MQGSSWLSKRQTQGKDANVVHTLWSQDANVVHTLRSQDHFQSTLLLPECWFPTPNNKYILYQVTVRKVDLGIVLFWCLLQYQLSLP